MIIGRTNRLAELRSNKNTLTKSRYYYISHLARDFIMDNCICTLPVDLFYIIRKNNWKIIKYSSLIANNIMTYKEIMEYNWGFTEHYGENNYVIFYNDILNEQIQRFTLAHEIGHILLDHFNVNVENREQEANMFAARLLMPMCVLHECNISNSIEISLICNVSLISANYRYKRLKILEQRNKFYTDKNEIKLRNIFKKFIKNYNKKLKKNKN